METKLQNVEEVKKIDVANMANDLKAFSNQLKEAQEIAGKFIIPDDWKEFKPSGIVLAGMGGSAMGGDLVRNYTQYELKIPFTIIRNYDLPKYVNENYLVFISSYSGNTEETVNALYEAINRNAKIICIASGGTIEEEAKKNNLPLISLPKGFPPRVALGYSFVPILKVLENLNLISDKQGEVNKTKELLEKLGNEYCVENNENKAKELAEKIYNGGNMVTPVIYGSDNFFSSVAARWQIFIYENAKAYSAIGIFPELSHNQMMGWLGIQDSFKDFIFILLRNPDEHDAMKKRVEASKNILIEKFGEDKVIEVYPQGETTLEHIFSLIYLGDWISYYLAILKGIDPTKVELVEKLKTMLKE